ncbi:MAG TPA: hypothetical protein PLP34_03355, partial [Chitinophagaceae bacterium]|nr:hypothetical protein [Chitinophagaceae bacterium]
MQYYRIFTLGLLSLVLHAGLVFQGMAQTAPYCINSRFAEQDYFADIAIDSAVNVVYGYNSNVSVAVD